MRWLRWLLPLALSLAALPARAEPLARPVYLPLVTQPRVTVRLTLPPLVDCGGYAAHGCPHE